MWDAKGQHVCGYGCQEFAPPGLILGLGLGRGPCDACAAQGGSMCVSMGVRDLALPVLILDLGLGRGSCDASGLQGARMCVAKAVGDSLPRGLIMGTGAVVSCMWSRRPLYAQQ